MHYTADFCMRHYAGFSQIGSHIVIGIGRGILLKYEKSSLHEFGGPITLNKDWAIGVLC